MTVATANCLIPYMPCGYQESIHREQTLEHIIYDMLQVLQDESRLNQLFAFSQMFRAVTQQKQIEKLAQLHRFVVDHITYKVDPVYEQLIKDPICTWQQRKQGTDCKSLTVFIYAVLYNLGLPRQANIFVYPKEQIAPNEYKQPSHIFPSTFIGNQEIYLDATIENFNRLPSAPLEWRKEYGV